jgi:phosphate starvation-inducible PhoH-like protein
MTEEFVESEKARKRRERKAAKNAAFKRKGPTQLIPRNERQSEYLDALQDSDQIFAIGPAGTGKTYLAARVMARRLKAGNIEKIYVARATVAPARHRQGFLPGKLEAKLKPWMTPIFDAFKEEMSSHELDRMMMEGKIEILSFEHLRGRTLLNCSVILDEAQNCTYEDFKLFLTRKGENCTYIICGDTTQVDDSEIMSGFDSILTMVEKYDLDADIIEFLEEDVVRSAHAKEWVIAFSKETPTSTLTS